MATHESSSSAFNAGLTALMAAAKAAPETPAAAEAAAVWAADKPGTAAPVTETTNAPAALRKSRREVTNSVDVFA